MMYSKSFNKVILLVGKTIVDMYPLFHIVDNGFVQKLPMKKTKKKVNIKVDKGMIDMLPSS